MVEIKGIRKRYGKKLVLDDITCTISAGTIVGMIGENGSGKTTLMSILAGVRKPDGGTFTLFGVDALADRGAPQRYCSYIPQENPLFEDMSVRDNMRLLLDGRDIREKIIHSARAYGLEHVLGEKVWKLSGGMKRRVTVACALAENRAVLLMDEPTASLDLKSKQEIHAWIQRHRDREGIVILNTHEKAEMELCDKLYLLKDGNMTQMS